MPTNLSSSDSEVSENFSDSPEFPIHENLRTCTRQTPCSKQSCLTSTFTADSNSILCTMQNPCFKQTCLVCSSPTDSNHIWNLTTALNTTTSKATIATKPAPPIDHWIYNFTGGIQDTILRNDLPKLKFFNKTAMPRNLCPNLRSWNLTAPTFSPPRLTPIWSSTPLLLFPIHILHLPLLLLLLDSSLPG